MNKHIELVKKFSDDNTSVTLEELKANKEAACEAAWAYRAANYSTRGYNADVNAIDESMDNRAADARAVLKMGN